MKVAFYDSTREYNQHKDEFDGAVRGVMSRGDFILGRDVSEFEKEAAEWLGVKYAVGVASGSDALVLGADILGLKDGSEVITPTFTFFASTSCIARLGAKPVFVDIDENTLNMDTTLIERKISDKTKGIIPVHLFTQTADMQGVMDLAGRHGLKVLEDSAEAWGMKALVNGQLRSAGTVGAIGIYSFFPTKTLGAYGDAGLMVTNDEQLYGLIKSYRVHGSSVKYQHDYIGYNSRLDTIQAAILRVKLKYSSDSIRAREIHAAHYRRLLEDLPGVRIPGVLKGNQPVYYVYSILVKNRDELAKHLRDHEVGYSIYYPRPLHLQKCFAYLGYKKGDFPVSEQVCDEIISLPIYPEITEDEVEYVGQTIRRFMRR